MKKPVLSCLMLRHRCSCYRLRWRLPREQDYDVVVYGGTSGGVAAAVQAARMGKSVVLIEPGTHLGGLTSGGLGATDIGNKAAIGGIAREFYQRDRAALRRPRRLEARDGPASTDQRPRHRYARTTPMWTFEPHVAEQI